MRGEEEGRQEGLGEEQGAESVGGEGLEEDGVRGGFQRVSLVGSHDAWKDRTNEGRQRWGIRSVLETSAVRRTGDVQQEIQSLPLEILGEGVDGGFRPQIARVGLISQVLHVFSEGHVQSMDLVALRWL